MMIDVNDVAEDGKGSKHRGVPKVRVTVIKDGASRKRI